MLVLHVKTWDGGKKEIFFSPLNKRDVSEDGEKSSEVVFWKCQGDGKVNANCLSEQKPVSAVLKQHI